MGATGDVRAIRERSMDRMRAEHDPERAIAVALSGLWDAVEVLALALDEDSPADDAARDDLAQLVRSLPDRLASVGDDALATSAVVHHLAEVVALSRARARSSDAADGPATMGRLHLI